MMLLLGTTSDASGQEATKVTAGVPFIAEEDGVYVTEAEFISIVAALDSLDVERRKVAALRDTNASSEELIQALQRRLDFEAESCESLLKVYTEKPEPGFFDKVGEIGLWGTAGYALCTIANN